MNDHLLYDSIIYKLNYHKFNLYLNQQNLSINDYNLDKFYNHILKELLKMNVSDFCHLYQNNHHNFHLL